MFAALLCSTLKIVICLNGRIRIRNDSEIRIWNISFRIHTNVWTVPLIVDQFRFIEFNEQYNELHHLPDILYFYTVRCTQYICEYYLYIYIYILNLFGTNHENNRISGPHMTF
jgi:hypothetical protein